MHAAQQSFVHSAIRISMPVSWKRNRLGTLRVGRHEMNGGRNVYQYQFGYMGSSWIHTTLVTVVWYNGNSEFAVFDVLLS